MIFRPELAAAITRGDKVQTRRLVRAGEERCRYRPGGSYAVQPGRTRGAVCRIVVTHVERQRVGDITHEDAVAEGFASVEGFARYWLDLHDPVYREALEHASDDEVMERFRGRHGQREVWVISFVPDPSSAPRLLHRQSERGYTASPRDAMEDEPEAVDRWTQVAITREANRRTEMTRAKDASELRNDIRDITGRIALVRARAARHGRSVEDAIRRAALELRQAERAIERQAR